MGLLTQPIFPADSPAAPVTALLVQWRNGDQHALDELTPLIYTELRSLAASRLRLERDGHTLQATALVNEAFLRLSAGRAPDVDWENRNHFFAIAARLMRQILIQHARGRRASRRGGGAQVVSLEDTGPLMIGTEHEANLLEMDAALSKLESLDERKARAVELRYFGGLTVPEIALTIGVSTATAERDLRMALAFLRRELSPAS